MSITVASMMVLRSSSTLVPAALAALVCATLPPPIAMVILVRSAEPMVSLNVRITCVPSTFCPASIATAPWSRSALRVVLPVALMVPPLSVSLFAAIAMPFGAESFTATV